jgi:hypothetical protein
MHNDTFVFQDVAWKTVVGSNLGSTRIRNTSVNHIFSRTLLSSVSEKRTVSIFRMWTVSPASTEQTANILLAGMLFSWVVLLRCAENYSKTLQNCSVSQCPIGAGVRSEKTAVACFMTLPHIPQEGLGKMINLRKGGGRMHYGRPVLSSCSGDRVHWVIWRFPQSYPIKVRVVHLKSGHDHFLP